MNTITFTSKSFTKYYFLILTLNPSPFGEGLHPSPNGEGTGMRI